MHIIGNMRLIEQPAVVIEIKSDNIYILRKYLLMYH